MGGTLLCHSRLLLLLGLGWLVLQPLVAQAWVLLALGWQSSLLWPVAQLQRAPPALSNALHVQRCIAVPVQPPAWLWGWLGFGSLALAFALALNGLGGLSCRLSLGAFVALGWHGSAGPGSEAAGCVAAWLLRGACNGLRGGTTGHHIRPRTGWSRCWLHAGRTRRCSTCPAGGSQPAVLVALSVFSSTSQGCLPFTAELTQVVRCSSTSTTLPRRWPAPLGLHTTLQQARNTASAPHPPPVPMLAAPKNTTSCLACPWHSMDTSAVSSSNCSHAHKAHTWWLIWWHQRPVLGSVQPQPLSCPLGVQVHLPHRMPGGQGDSDVLQPPLSVTAGIVQAAGMLHLALGQLPPALGQLSRVLLVLVATLPLLLSHHAEPGGGLLRQLVIPKYMLHENTRYIPARSRPPCTMPSRTLQP
ncbi:hypothetical protein HaLaN_03916 [Haematococcus lacustris]|uniref:Uncharacterized protein n=1 Tax=Haematococcus lacustris TaxID=44745 RepID=A0A699YFJ5_HAELA|nr:hypothetical protein HaLaN_03916 [Haematococcus lacustris]